MGVRGLRELGALLLLLLRRWMLGLRERIGGCWGRRRVRRRRWIALLSAEAEEEEVRPTDDLGRCSAESEFSKL